MDKINVLEFIGSLKIGGAEKHAVGLTKRLNKDRYNVTFCCMMGGGLLEEELKGEKVEIVHLNFRTRYFFIAFFKLLRLMRRKRIDILHAHLFHCGFWGRIAALLTGVPVIIYTEQGKSLWKRRRHILFERMANHFTDMRIAVSEDIRKLCIEREKTPPDKFVYIPNAIDAEDYVVSKERSSETRKEIGLGDGGPVIGTVARLNFAKALEYMLQAFSIVRESFPNARCLLVGDGELRGDLENWAKKLGIEDSTLFLGARTDVPELLSVMDVFVLSSITEGTPISLLEAVVAGVPAVGTDVGGIPEVIENRVTGILVPPRDEVKLAQGIIDLLSDGELREKVIDAAYAKVTKSYSLAATAKRIEDIYERFYMEKSK